MSDCISHNGEQWVRLAWYEQRGGDLVAAEDHIRDLESCLAKMTTHASDLEAQLAAIDKAARMGYGEIQVSWHGDGHGFHVTIMRREGDACGHGVTVTEACAAAINAAKAGEAQ